MTGCVLTQESVGRCTSIYAFRLQSRAPAAHWLRVSPSARRVELDAKNPAFGLNQEPRGLLGFGLTGSAGAASAFTRPVSAMT